MKGQPRQRHRWKRAGVSEVHVRSGRGRVEAKSRSAWGGLQCRAGEGVMPLAMNLEGVGFDWGRMGWWLFSVGSLWRCHVQNEHVGDSIELPVG